MCEANVYLLNHDTEESELLMEAVDRIIPTDGEIMLESIFGQRKILKSQN